jgi:hypothetical protein
LIVVSFNGLRLKFKMMQKKMVSAVLEERVHNACFVAPEQPIRNAEVFQWDMGLLSSGKYA